MSEAPVRMLGYAPFVRELTHLLGASPSDLAGAGFEAMLDGRAAADLRRLVSLTARRSVGAFFTPESLADRLTEPLEDARGRCVVVDPACGAGDLLLSSARRLLGRTPTARMPPKFVGIDIVPEFVAASELRLDLLLRSLRQTGDAMRAEKEFACTDGRMSSALGGASHIVVNPPFTVTAAPQGCEWSSGSVNAAAPFLLDCIGRAAPGTRIRAILPEVLRSGTRYRRWRDHVSAVAEIVAIESVGQFDRWTDVDVFLLDVIVGPKGSSSVRWTGAPARTTVADFFTIGVGPVVHYRDPMLGSWQPYLTSKAFPAWTTIGRVVASRRFQGRLVNSPFVVIPRTSRPSEPQRARGAVVIDDRPVAVDNHLIVLKPRDGSRATCESLLSVLRGPMTADWLNNRIRCRHLTTDAVGTIPWSVT